MSAEWPNPTLPIGCLERPEIALLSCSALRDGRLLPSRLRRRTLHRGIFRAHAAGRLGRAMSNHSLEECWRARSSAIAALEIAGLGMHQYSGVEDRYAANGSEKSVGHDARKSHPDRSIKPVWRNKQRCARFDHVAPARITLVGASEKGGRRAEM